MSQRLCTQTKDLRVQSPKDCTLLQQIARTRPLAGRCDKCKPGRKTTHRVGANGNLAAQGLSHLIKRWRYVRLIRDGQPHNHAVKWHELPLCQKLLPCNLHYPAQQWATSALMLTAPVAGMPREMHVLAAWRQGPCCKTLAKALLSVQSSLPDVVLHADW